jgi:hypothetical protein
VRTCAFCLSFRKWFGWRTGLSLSAGYQGFPSAFVRKKNRLLRLDRPDPCGDLQCVSLSVLAGEPPKFIKIGLTCPGLEDNLMRDEEDHGQFSCRACATLGTK